MTTIFKQDVKCAVCGSTHSYTICGSTNAFGPADLDGRPPEMARSTMYTWVQRCPACGYCAGTIKAKTKINRDWLESEAYQTCEGHDIKSELARKFYRAAMILLHDGKTEEAAESFMFSAWASDDEGDTESAKTCRLKSAELLKEVPDDEYTEFRITQRMELLRRAGQFERVLNEFNDVEFKEFKLGKKAKVERKLAEEKDDTCHTTYLIFNNSPAWDEVVPISRKQTESE